MICYGLGIFRVLSDNLEGALNTDWEYSLIPIA